MSTNEIPSRRTFMKSSAAAGVTALTLGVTKDVRGANEKVRLAWIGTGGRGRELLKRTLFNKGIEVVSVCDLRPERVAQAKEICAEEEAKVTTYSDYRKLLDTEKLDGVVVATEVGNHAKCVVPVLEAGLNCFSEKPMDCTIEKVDKIVATARKAKGVYQVGFQRRCDKGYRAGVQAIRDGDIGNVHFMQGQWHWTWQIGGWVLDVDMSGGEIVEQACHHMDLMNWVMGNQPPLRCAAMGATNHTYKNPPKHVSEDKCAVSFEFPGGAIFSYTHLFYLCDQFTGEKSWVMGEKGGIDLLEGKRYPRPGMGEPSQIGENQPSWGNPSIDIEIDEFADSCRTGKMPASNCETGRVSTFMSLMARKAMYDRSTKKFETKIVE